MGNQSNQELGRQADNLFARGGLTGEDAGSLSSTGDAQIDGRFRQVLELRDPEMSQGGAGAVKRASMPPRRPLNVEPRGGFGELE
jgi:hypothetical protein